MATTFLGAQINALPEDLRGRETFQDVWGDNAGEGEGERCMDLSSYNPSNPCPVPGFAVGGLVAKIDDKEPFGIGNINTFTASDDGMIYLRINDGERQGLLGLSDNAGLLAVEIIRK